MKRPNRNPESFRKRTTELEMIYYVKCKSCGAQYGTHSRPSKCGACESINITAREKYEDLLPIHEHCIICQNEGEHSPGRPHVMEGQE